MIASVEYSDGFGRLLQTRTQAEDTLFGDAHFGGAVIPAEPGGNAPATTARTAADHVVVSGWQIYDNKGRVVETLRAVLRPRVRLRAAGGRPARPEGDDLLRPARSDDPDGQPGRQRAARRPRGSGRPRRTRTLFAPTPWETFTYDANDNAGRTHHATAAGYQDHWNTPASIEVDALGRTVTAVARNGAEEITTRSRYDIQGNLVAITDALGRPAFGYRFDLAKRRWRMDSIDAGRRDTVLDAAGQPDRVPRREGRAQPGRVRRAAPTDPRVGARRRRRDR